MRNFAKNHPRIKMIRILIWIMLFLPFAISSCSISNGASKASGHSVSRDHQISNKDHKDLEIRKGHPDILIGYNNLKLITELNKTIQSKGTSFKPSELGCDEWFLKESSLHNILTKMQKVDSYALNARCDIYPCWFSGKVSNGDEEYNINVNSASHVVLRNEKEEIYFILKETNDLFLQPCDCCDEDK